MNTGRRALSALLIATALGGGSLALAQALPSITVGTPATVAVPAVSGIPLTIETAGEYQLDATGSSLDTELAVFLNGAVIATDSDSGDGTDARLVSFLEPGTYDVRLTERGGRATTSSVTAVALPPRTPVATITPGGRPTRVTLTASESPRDASADLALTITGAGSYRIDVSDATLDAELQLIANGSVLAAGSEVLGTTNAQLVRELTPGDYTLRVRDRLNRAGTLSVTVGPQ